jgi:hypothetical protein
MIMESVLATPHQKSVIVTCIAATLTHMSTAYGVCVNKSTRLVRSLCSYSNSLVTYKAVSLTVAKSKPLVFLNSETYLKNEVRTSQETDYVSATKPNRLMLFRETHCLLWNHTEHNIA